ncbi:chymotrypsin inhibitor-like [Lasioglossum baleicum]|uniref:chymotrypsin inhibitor-like n=1 Tax=Lasioglossum baleicum TaxID=434251 RepID=UPI003FCE8674
MQGKFEILLLLAALYVASAEVVGPECPENAEWNLCGELCAPTCDLPHPNTRLCPHIVCTKFTAGCRCNKGYVRDSEGSGKCILEKDCHV